MSNSILTGASLHQQLARVYTNPEILSERRVYANMLVGLGDPRGEYINLELDCESLNESQRRRADELFEGNKEAWLGELGDVVDVEGDAEWNAGLRHHTGAYYSLGDDIRLRFDEGFLSHCPLRNTVGQARLRAVLAHPMMATVRTLRVFRIDDLSLLWPLRSLDRLHVNDEEVEDLTPLSAMPKLSTLRLASNSICDVSALSALPLTKLHCQSRMLSEAEPLGALVKLEDLDLSSTSITHFTPLSNLRNLKNLELYGTTVNELQFIAPLSLLESVELGATKVDALGPLRHLPELIRLRLSDTAVTDLSPLEGLQQLEVLDIAGTGVVDIDVLLEFSKLRTLYVAETKIPRRSLERLQKKLPKLEIDVLASQAV